MTRCGRPLRFHEVSDTRFTLVDMADTGSTGWVSVSTSFAETVTFYGSRTLEGLQRSAPQDERGCTTR